MTTTTTNIRFRNYTMTEQQYETNASAIATSIWKISTGNGRDLDLDDWGSHMQNCHAAVANTYTDGINQAAWHNAALGIVQ